MEVELDLSCAVMCWILWEVQSHTECPCHGSALQPMCKDWTMYPRHSHKKTWIGQIRKAIRADSSMYPLNRKYDRKKRKRVKFYFKSMLFL